MPLAASTTGGPGRGAALLVVCGVIPRDPLPSGKQRRAASTSEQQRRMCRVMRQEGAPASFASGWHAQCAWMRPAGRQAGCATCSAGRGGLQYYPKSPLCWCPPPLMPGPALWTGQVTTGPRTSQWQIKPQHLLRTPAFGGLRSSRSRLEP
jgi:hypothetical protein